MTHPREDLTAFVDGALAPADQARVAAHLAACPECSAERDRLAAAVATVAGLARPPVVAPGFEQRFYARLAEEKRPRLSFARRFGVDRGAWRWLAPGLAGAAAAAMVMVYAGGRHRADEAFVAQHLDLFEHYDEVAAMGVVDRPEDVEVVVHLRELRGRP